MAAQSLQERSRNPHCSASLQALCSKASCAAGGEQGSPAAPGLPESALRPSLVPPPPVHPLAQEAFFIIINSYCKPVKSFMGFG